MALLYETGYKPHSTALRAPVGSSSVVVDRLRFLEALRDIGLDPSDSQIDQFQAFEDALYRANEVMNLTRVPQEEAWLRHFVDSLLFQALILPGSMVLDIGTGPGFPAWPLACVRTDLHVTALDSSGKMLGFLRSHPLPNLEVIQARAEEWGGRETFDLVTGRAVAPLAIQLELSAPCAKRGGIVLPMRTPAEAAEIESFPAHQLGLKLKEQISRELPGTDIVRQFAIFEKSGLTPRIYPRTWAEIKRKPIGS